MKKKYSFTFFAFLVAIAAWAQEIPNNLVLDREQPVPGEKIQFFYQPAGTDLANEKEIIAIAYEYSPGKIQTYDVPLKKNKNVWAGTLKPSKEALGLYLKFQNNYREDGNYKVDRNSDKGYPILMYNKKKHLIPGATLVTASMLQEAQHHLKIKYNPKLALILFEQEFEKEPALKRPNITAYIKALLEERGKEPAVILGALDWLAAQPDLTEEELLLLHSTYRSFGKTDKADAYYFLMRKHWPRGQASRSERTKAYHGVASICRWHRN